MTIKLFVAGCIVAGTMSAFSADSEYSGESGYVTLDQSDSGSVYSFNSAGNWSNHEAPDAQNKYYVGSGLELRIPGNLSGVGAFPADIVIQGKVISSGSSGHDAKWTNVKMLPGSEYSFGATVGGIGAGAFTIEGTQASPVRFTYQRTSDYPKPMTMSLLSAADGYGCFKKENAGIAMLNGGGMDFSEYFGHFSFIGNCQFYLKANSEFPGELEAKSNVELCLSGSSSSFKFGTLILREGSVLQNVMEGNQNLFTVTNKFILEPGCSIVSRKNLYFRENGDNVFKEIAAKDITVVKLTKEAVENGLPSLEGVKVSCIVKNGYCELPTVSYNWKDNEIGGKDLVCGFRKVVYEKVDNDFDHSCFNTNSTDGATYFWSDGNWPHAGVDYWSDKALFVNFPVDHSNYSSYVFPGESLTIKSNLGIYKPSDLSFPLLSLYGGAIRPMSSAGENYVLRGRLSVYRADYGATKIYLAEGNVVTLAADLFGRGNIVPCVNSAYGDQYQTLPRGTLVLSGDNSGFKGKMIAFAPPIMTNRNTGGQSVPGSDANVTLKAMNGSSFGGACDAFVFDALTISNHTRLVFAANATFDAVNRGWFISDHAYMRSEKGQTAVLKETVTYNPESVVVKEGEGAVMLASEAVYTKSSDSHACWTVIQGSLGGGVADAFKGLTISFEAGSKLAVAVSGDAVMHESGVVLTDEVMVKNGVGLDFVDPEGSITSTDEFSIPVFTATKETADAVLAKLAGSGKANFGEIRLSYRLRKVESAGLVTVFADFYKGGFVIIVK